MLTRTIRIILSLILLSPLPAFANPNNEAGSGRPKSPWWSSSTPPNGYPKAAPDSTWAYPPEPPPKRNPIPSDFDLLEAREEAAWKRLEQAVLKKFDRYMQSSQKVWVDYSDQHDAMTQVDFETGEVQIEGMVEVSGNDVRAAAAHLIAKTAQALTQKRDLDGKPMMQTFFSTEAMDAIDGARLSPIIEETPVVGSDGVRRVKVRVALKMAPDHLKRRSERYLSQIRREAQKRGVDPALIAAVMHTESAFNPMARSNAPAFGLMQLVPRFAGREAYRRLYGVDTILSPEYLYRPESNIELGVAYLALLDRVYFKDVLDPVKRRYMVICAYNWGPTALKKMLRPMRVQEMEATQLFDLLQERVPLETKNYLKQVEVRRAGYLASFL
jgi:membrane-bound lytic murein transglycosylase C